MKRICARFSIHLFVDEFQNYVSPSVSHILTESRKYGLHITFANQTFGQNMREQIQDIILGNTFMKMCGANGTSTLRVFAREM